MKLCEKCQKNETLTVDLLCQECIDKLKNTTAKVNLVQDDITPGFHCSLSDAILRVKPKMGPRF